MGSETSASQLREMARHRGLKLITSRRRKPGMGDFGKYGLTDDKGKTLLGITEDGLTASAADIENFLRAGTASTWKQSAKAAPDRGSAAPLRARAEKPEDQQDAVRNRRAVPARHPTRAGRQPLNPERPARQPLDRSERPGGAKPASIATPEVPPIPDVQPRLAIRVARRGDGNALAKLLVQLGGTEITQTELARDLIALRKAGGGVHVAELEEVVGCSVWVSVPTLHRGRLGRVTALIVDEDHRRRGIGTRLLAAADGALTKKGCTLIEVMSDIEIKNSHNFFRALKFDQTSYRFTRKADDGRD